MEKLSSVKGESRAFFWIGGEKKLIYGEATGKMLVVFQKRRPRSGLLAIGGEAETCCGESCPASLGPVEYCPAPVVG